MRLIIYEQAQDSEIVQGKHHRRQRRNQLKYKMGIAGNFRNIRHDLRMVPNRGKNKRSREKYGNSE